MQCISFITRRAREALPVYSIEFPDMHAANRVPDLDLRAFIKEIGLHVPPNRRLLRTRRIHAAGSIGLEAGNVSVSGLHPFK